jgi:hypothetical protein
MPSREKPTWNVASGLHGDLSHRSPVWTLAIPKDQPAVKSKMIDVILRYRDQLQKHAVKTHVIRGSLPKDCITKVLNGGNLLCRCPLSPYQVAAIRIKKM